MGRIICAAKKNGEVPTRGNPSIEWYKDGVPQYYCYGYVDKMTGNLLETCRNCRDNVLYAQLDLDEWNKRHEI